MGIRGAIRYWTVVLIGVAVASSPEAAAQPSGPDGHIPIPPAETERRLTTEAIQIATVEGAGGGVTGAKKLGLVFPSDGLRLSIKWKPVPSKGDGWNNSPRRELAAYAIQKWFLDPDDYVVPPTVAACIPLDAYVSIDSHATPNIFDFPCVLGIASVWLDNVTVPETLHDPERFESDPRYAYHLSNMNVLGILIKHEDGREGNFLTARNETDRRVFAVDNGISFGVIVHNFFVQNWHKARTAGLRKAVIDRLRAIGPAEMDALGTIAELAPDENGILRNRPATANLAPKKGARITREAIQLGLSKSEIRKVGKRLEDLLEDVDDGDISTF